MSSAPEPQTQLESLTLKWSRYARTHWRAPSEEASDAVVSRLVAAELEGSPSCVWHEAHLWYIENVDYPDCEYCGGPSDPKIGFHWICKLRAAKALPVPRLDARPECSCADCAA